MNKLTFFDTVAELEELTGLNEDQLWDKGFCLDDWDWGFVSDVNFGQDIKDDYGYDTYEWEWNGVPQYIDFILTRMQNYCVGFMHTEYNGRHYFLLYHS